MDIKFLRTGRIWALRLCLGFRFKVYKFQSYVLLLYYYSIFETTNSKAQTSAATNKRTCYAYAFYKEDFFIIGPL